MKMHPYKQCIEYAKTHIAKSVALGFNTCVDAIRHIRYDEIKDLKMPEELSGLVECMRNGVQREVSISKDTLGFLVDKIGYESFRIGGQVGNMTNVAAKLGVRVFPHVARKCRKQMELFERGDILIADKNGFRKPGYFLNDCTPSVHFVLEFEKGDIVNKIEIPCSNRFIASHDPQNFRLEIDEDFRKNIRDVIRDIDVAVVSGFQLLEEGYAHRIREVKEDIYQWKKINPNLKVHTEMADFQSRKVIEEVIKHILPAVDSIGFNEIELGQMTGGLGEKDALAEVSRKVKRVVYHNEEFSMMISDEDREHMSHTLRFASIVAAYKATHGTPPSFDDLDMFVPKEPSRAGIEKVEEFEQCDFGKNSVSVPSFLIEKPESAVGLGDCFTAAHVLLIR